MSFFFEVLIGGLLSGVMYSLVALGFVLIYKASGVFNFAQGAMVFFAALTCVALTEYGLNFWLAVLVTLVAMVVRTDGPEATLFEPVKRAVSAVDPALAMSRVGTMADVIADERGQRRGLTVLLGVFAAFALGLSALALYASLSYSVVQRRSELAVRMAVGASTPSILRLVVAEGLAATVVGIAIGGAASLSLGKVLANQVYGVGTSDPGTLVSISLVLTLAVVAACVVPGLRAIRTDPALALRE